jgi:GR25 family glycosyltransferase involved in LPS biosynthesis
MNIEELFKNTLVLSLPHRLDRKIHIEKELKKHNINFDFFDAINGLEKSYNGPLKNGEYGIKESHIHILKKCIEKNYSGVTIFEDDAVLHDNFKYELSKNSHSLPEDLDILYFGASHHIAPTQILDNVYKVNYAFTTHAMYISKNVFELLIKIQLQNPHVPLDVCYAYLHDKLNCYCFYPHLAWQMNDYSDIQNQFVNYDFLKKEFVRFEN